MTRQETGPVLPAEQQLIAYWQSLSAASRSRCPARRDINPCHMGAALANVSLLQADPATGLVFRLAGSAIQALAGRPLGGVPVSAVQGALAGHWARGSRQALALGEPVRGRAAAVTDGWDMAWLRLPLLDERGERSLVLCHDCRVRSAPEKHPEIVFIHGVHRAIAA